MISRCTIFAALLVILSPPALALTYECKIISGNSQYIPDVVNIKYDTNTGAVVVSDSLIMSVLGQPVVGQVDIETKSRVSFKWFVDGIVTRTQQRAKILFRATVRKNNNKLTLSAKPLGFKENLRGTGSCLAR